MRMAPKPIAPEPSDMPSRSHRRYSAGYRFFNVDKTLIQHL